MSTRDKWGLFMIVVAVITIIGGVQSGADGGELATGLFGAAIVYWMGTGFIKDKPKDAE